MRGSAKTGFFPAVTHARCREHPVPLSQRAECTEQGTGTELAACGTGPLRSLKAGGKVTGSAQQKKQISWEGRNQSGW